MEEEKKKAVKAEVKKVTEEKAEEVEKPTESEEKKEEIKIEEKAVKAEKKEEKPVAKQILEREYIVPLRREWSKVPEYKRANKAVKALKEFIAQHMRVENRDLRKVKVDVYLNNEIRFRGMRKPPAKIKVKAIKFDDGNVSVKLVEFPKHIEFEIARKVRKAAEALKSAPKEKPVKAEKKEEVKESIDTKEKEAASQEEGLKIAKKEAKIKEHSTGSKREPLIQRKALKR